METLKETSVIRFEDLDSATDYVENMKFAADKERYVLTKYTVEHKITKAEDFYVVTLVRDFTKYGA